jgi:hypothetical protein
MLDRAEDPGCAHSILIDSQSMGMKTVLAAAIASTLI